MSKSKVVESNYWASKNIKKFDLIKYEHLDFTKKVSISWSINNKTFNKGENRALLTLRRLQKHHEVFSNNVLRKNITQKQFKRWLRLVSISQTALG